MRFEFLRRLAGPFGMRPPVLKTQIRAYPANKTPSSSSKGYEAAPGSS